MNLNIPLSVCFDDATHGRFASCIENIMLKNISFFKNRLMKRLLLSVMCNETHILTIRFNISHKHDIVE